ncbi:MAG: transcription elongation factor spt5 [Caeruleum heppii]|nr:MAG: transcription elongation factor spt5 [Caeruleum heppii]
MSTTNLLDQDFGSESDDDNNFNPAPADESDPDDEDVTSKKSPRRRSPERRPSRRASAEEGDAKEVESSANGKAGDPSDEDEGDEGPSRRSADKRAGEAGDDADEVAEDGEDENAGEDDENDDEEDDEEDEEDEEVMGHRRKRTKKRATHGFFDVEAEVDEGDEDIEEDEDELKEAEGFIDNTHPDDAADLPATGDVDDRHHRALDRRREVEASLDAERQAEEYRKRYGRNRAAPSESIVIPKRLLLPSVEDPSIWGVRCKQGKEREAVLAITRRIEERAKTRAPLSITCAFERGGTMASYVYVEARKQADILTALDGLSNVYPRTKMILVPIKEMPDLLRTTKSKDIEPGSWVRVKRGKYQGDLAQVEDVVSNGLEVGLRIVPRLDYGLNEDANAPMTDNGVKGALAKRKRAGALGLNNPAGRPPQRLFSEVEAKKKHLKYLQPLPGKKNWQYLGDTYQNGYLVKDFKIQLLQTENVDPTLEEVTKFASNGDDGTENLDLNALMSSLKASSASAAYLPGDMVEVYEGEQKGVSGKATAVHGDIVTLNVTEGDLRGQTMEVPVKGLRKRFRTGDHVKVIGGSKYRDDVGMVVRISADRVTVLSDQTLQEITVFSKDLREATDTGRAGAVGMYDLYDLVQLDQATVGIVVKVDRESLRVLDQNGSIRSLMPSQISNKLEKRRHAVATDRNGSEIRHDDTVREVGGESKQGTILHIYRSFVFLHNREQTENSGVFVARTTNVATVAAKGGRVVGNVNGPDLTKMNPAVQRNGVANGSMAPPVAKSYGRDRALGKTITIKKGAYKGLLGIVKDTTDTDARVELHTNSKTITVPKAILAFKDPLTGQSIDYNSFSGGRGRGGGGRGNYGGATPSRVPNWEGSRTPMAGGMEMRTPAWGAVSRTPAWAGGGAASGARTPAWKQDAIGGRTPAYGGDGGRTVNPYLDGSRTSYGGGNKTPAWNAGAQTPYGDSGFSGSRTPAYGGGEAWNSGSRTPAYGASSHGDVWGASGSRTPAYGNSSTSHLNNDSSWGANSRSYDAPTPGGDQLSAPTPGALNAPTPGAYNAPTPAAAAASMPTPRGWGESAPTPAASGSGGGFSAPTPGSYGGRGAPTPGAYGAPETPGWGAEDGDAEGDTGPRYED